MAWIDESDSSNYTRSGTSLTGVTDKSGTYTITVGGDVVTNSSTQNSLNVFDFDGNGDYLQSTTYGHKYPLVTIGELEYSDGKM